MLYALISRFPQNLFFRDFASPPLIGVAMRYADVPQAGYLAADLSCREHLVDGGETVEVELRAFVYSQQGRFFELHPIDKLLLHSFSSNCLR